MPRWRTARPSSPRRSAHSPTTVALPGFQNQAITAGEAIYTGTVYPASLRNNFFFTNFTNGQVFAIDINNSANVKFLYSVSGDAPVDFVQGPDGLVYYADLGTA